MKLKKVKNGENIKRGKNAKRKGGNYERDIAKRFGDKYDTELKRTPQSGGFAKKSERADEYKGDIVIISPDEYLKVSIECKNQKTWQLKQWIEQAENDAPDSKIPLVVFHKHGTNKDYVCLSLDNFFGIVERDKVIGSKA